MKYEIYQVVLSKNTELAMQLGQDEGSLARLHPEFKAYREAMFGVHQNSNSKYYKHVADIEADSLEEVFEIGNIGPECKIKRILPMHSLSVGDIVYEVETSKYFFCARYGWKEVYNNEIRAA